MGADFDEDVGAAIHNALDCLLEQHRFADVMPPVLRVECRSLLQGTGDGRVEGRERFTWLELCQCPSDTGLDLVHGRAVKCVIKIEPFIENLTVL